MRYLLLAFLLFSTLPAFAGTYVADNTITADMLSTPPATDSTAWKADIETTLKANQAATPAQKAAILDETRVRLTHITSVVDPSWSEKSHPATFKLLEHARKDCKDASEGIKKVWNTKRPFLMDKRITKLVDHQISSAAYPSGHTACSRVMAEVMALAVPAKREELRTQANSIAWHRVIAGVHYPHDLNGGRQLAMLLFGAMQTSPTFQADLAAAKAEIAEKQ